MMGTVGLVAMEVPVSAEALSGSEFNAESIISDDLFYDNNAMSQAEIQSFLNSKIGTCYNGACLNVLSASVASRAREVSSLTGSVICEAFEGGTLSAAAIIYRAQVACNISAKVILVTLQKEQGLITNNAPGQAALDRAMGMACPDTAPCAPASLGFGNQIYKGTRQLNTYKAARFAKQPGTHFIGYHPSTSCGGTTLRIQNYATAALYNYTPYQPNAAALANLGGTGDGCSSYGNRNFWVFYNSWFGSTTGTKVTQTDTSAHVLVRDSAGALWVYSSDGKGRWLQPAQVGTGWNGMVTVFGAGDFDGDGHRDVLALDAAGVLWMYPGDGGVGLGGQVQISSGWGATTMLFSAGDFNGDGKQDVLARDPEGLLWMHSGTGRGKLMPPVQIGNGWNMMDMIIGAGDFNGDGNPDVIARSQSNLWLYPGNGSGSWLAPTQIGYGWSGMTSLSSPGDFDGDGNVDVFARDAAGGMYLYPGNGRGSWLTPRSLGAGWGGMNVIVGAGSKAGTVYVDQPGIGDLNGDGFRDVLARDAAGVLWLYSGNGKSSWLGSQKVSDDWNTMTATLGVSDFTGDGRDDVLARDEAGLMWVYPGNGSSGFSERIAAGFGWEAMKSVFGAGDVNGDKFPDVLAVDPAGNLMLYAGNGSGGWLSSSWVGNGWGQMTALFNAGDFGGDGYADLLARDGSGNMWLYRGNGNGGWYPSVQVGNGWGPMTMVFSPGDFSGDGKTDVIARDPSGNLWLYRGNGQGSWLGASSMIGNGWNMMNWIG